MAAHGLRDRLQSRSRPKMDSSKTTTQPSIAPLLPSIDSRIPFAIAALGLAAAYTLIWFVRWAYQGLTDDAMLYTMQALARMRPELTHDLFLRYGSQDNYTIFTPIFAWLIERIGLMPASAGLTLVFHIWSIIAAWFIARRITTSAVAWLAVGVLLVVPGEYGALGVFQHSEMFLTARLPAEALVLTSLALQLSDRPRLSLLLLATALCMHPLMAAPGVALWTLVRYPELRRPALFFGAAAAALLLLTATAVFFPMRPLALMDPAWLDVVRSRSFYIFVDRWRAVDWDLALLPVLTLIYASVANEDVTLRKLSLAAALVAVLGALITAFTTFLPIELVVKGQAWRWMWIATFLSMIMLPVTVVTRWQALAPMQRASIVLLCVAWTVMVAWAFPIPLASALVVWSLALLWRGERIPAIYQKYVWILVLSVAAVLLSTVFGSVLALLELTFTTNREPLLLERTRDVLGLTVPAVVIVVIVWLSTVRSARLVGVTVAAVLTALAIFFVAPLVYRNWTAMPYERAYPAFAEWRAAVDHRRSVLWPGDPLAVWLLLDSPGYLTIAQTAGVVFSRETAIEAARRAAVLRPMTGHDQFAIGGEKWRLSGRMTDQAFQALCADPELGYVVTLQQLNAPHLVSPSGRWSGLKLYSCDSVKAQAP